MKNNFFDNVNQLPDVCGIGDKSFDPIWATSNHQSGSCELLLVMEGRIRTVFYRRRSLVSVPGNIILIPNNVAHRDEFDLRSGIKVFMVSFRWKHEEQYFKAFPPTAIRRVGEDAHRVAVRQCEQMRVLLQSGTEADRVLCSAHLLIILLTMLRAHLAAGSRRRQAAAQKGQNHRRSLMLRARRYIDAHYTDEISLEHIADRLQISPFYLSHVFSQENDFSLLEYLINRRMQEAKLLLQSGRYSIKEAAFAVGYKDANYFSKVFHRHFGFTPRDLRRAAGG